MKGSQSVGKGEHMLSAGLVLSSSSSSSFDLFCFISLLRFSSSLYNTRHYDFFMSFSFCPLLHSLIIAHFFIPYHTPVFFCVGYYLLCNSSLLSYSPKMVFISPSSSSNLSIHSLALAVQVTRWSQAFV